MAAAASSRDAHLLLVIALIARGYANPARYFTSCLSERRGPNRSTGNSTMRRDAAEIPLVILTTGLYLKSCFHLMTSTSALHYQLTCDRISSYKLLLHSPSYSCYFSKHPLFFPTSNATNRLNCFNFSCSLENHCNYPFFFSSSSSLFS